VTKWKERELGHLRMILECHQSHSTHEMARLASQTIKNRTVNAIAHKLRELQAQQEFTEDHVLIEGRKYPAEVVSGYIVLTLPGGDKVMMHHFVWRNEFGDIPEGYHIHHRNDKRIDNRITNLQLMTAEDHISYHMSGRPPETAALFWYLQEKELWEDYLNYRAELLDRVQKKP
jgi:hypothetical protein